MGAYTDYFRPKQDMFFCQFVMSGARHEWSASPDGPWEEVAHTPLKQVDREVHFGGSAQGLQDGRPSASFWGSQTEKGGCGEVGVVEKQVELSAAELERFDTASLLETGASGSYFKAAGAA